jgi:hypothetical protein
MFNVQRPPISKTADYLPDFSRVVARLGARNKSDTVSVVSHGTSSTARFRPLPKTKTKACERRPLALRNTKVDFRPVNGVCRYETIQSNLRFEKEEIGNFS